ncbi:hypothetical protein AA106555_1794 [Neokomagataea thailandica NBRC 106555]|uniref:DUF2158 domain-containing protein n=1 Tax=Neokomagataea thailandica NBRC 106555 TaxID=1223520 RepID=A0ABQ0QRZ8_9PROT|nr:hypothetical protein AA106555_1794 [Neokomagataea thailandica NBRC 106555]
MSKFKKGDVVQLITGSPHMVISYYNQTDSTYLCVWFSEEKKDFINTVLDECVLFTSPTFQISDKDL